MTISEMAEREIEWALRRYDRYTANDNMTHAGAAQAVMKALSVRFEIKMKEEND